MPEQKVAIATTETEFDQLARSLSAARTCYDELLQRLSTIGHRIEDTNLPKADENIKNMKESPRPGILYELSNEAEMIHKKNDWLQDIVIKLERLF